MTRNDGRAGQGKLLRPVAPPGSVRSPRGEPPNRAARRAKRGAKPHGPPRPITRLENGDIGYACDPMRRDDCFRAAVATATQIHVEQLPDLRLQDRLDAGEDPDEISDESWQRIADWLDGRGLQLVVHKIVPADRERWIGVCVTPGLTRILDERRQFTDHCLVMSHGTVIFDPAKSVMAPRGTEVKTWQPADVTYGLSFDPQMKE